MSSVELLANEIDPLENLYKQPTLDEMVEMHLKSEKNKGQPRI